MLQRCLRSVVCSFAAAILAGCSASAPTVQSIGTLPTNGTVAVIGPDRADDETDRIVADWLSARGLNRDEQPQFLLQWAASRRPVTTGLLARGDAAEPSAWLSAPVRNGSRRVERVSLSLIEVATGREVYRASATMRTGRSAPDDRSRLVGALFAAPQDAEQAGLSGSAIPPRREEAKR
jgi:hypothetical protein